MFPAIRETADRAAWPRPSAVGRSAAILRSASARRSSVSRSLSWAAFMSPGTSNFRARRASSSAARRELIHLHLEVLTLLGAVAQEAEERLADVAVRAGDDRRHVAVVGLERVLLLARDAALDPEDDDDDQKQRDAQAHGLADAHGLAVGSARRLARGTLSVAAVATSSSRTAWARLTRDACWLVTFVEERHSMAPSGSPCSV